MIALALLAALAAFALLALSSDPQRRRWLGARATPTRARRVMRGTAWGSLALALALSVVARGWVFGPILWSGLVMLAAGMVFLFLNIIPAPHERTAR